MNFQERVGRSVRSFTYDIVEKINNESLTHVDYLDKSTAKNHMREMLVERNGKKYSVKTSGSMAGWVFLRPRPIMDLFKEELRSELHSIESRLDLS